MTTHTFYSYSSAELRGLTEEERIAVTEDIESMIDDDLPTFRLAEATHMRNVWEGNLKSYARTLLASSRRLTK